MVFEWEPGTRRVRYSPLAAMAEVRGGTGPGDANRTRAGDTAWPVSAVLGSQAAGSQQQARPSFDTVGLAPSPWSETVAGHLHVDGATVFWAVGEGASG